MMLLCVWFGLYWVLPSFFDHYIISGDVIGFRLFRATGLAFAIRYYKLLSLFDIINWRSLLKVHLHLIYNCFSGPWNDAEPSPADIKRIVYLAQQQFFKTVKGGSAHLDQKKAKSLNKKSSSGDIPAYVILSDA